MGQSSDEELLAAIAAGPELHLSPTAASSR